jgi:hypothetical protein
MLILSIVTDPLRMSPIGIIIAFVFLGSIIGILSWMLRLPKETERTLQVTKAVRSVKKQTRILVPLLGTEETNDRLIVIAVQMAHYRSGEVELLAAIEVPFTLPLDARVEQDEREALEKLEQAALVAAQSLGGSKNGTRVHKRLLKARRTGVAIVHEAEDQAVDLLLVANQPATVRGTSQQIDPAVEYVMKNAPCEVLIFSQARAAASYAHVMEEEASSTKAPTGAAD